MIRALLLDLDGTLVHSEPVAARALMEVFARHGQQIVEGDADFVVGRTWASALTLIQERLGLPAPRDQLLAEILGLYRARLRTEVPEVPGAARAIEALSTEFKLAVVSGSFRDEIELALEGLGVRSRISLVLGAEDYPSSKPAPDGYALALSRMGLRPSEAVVFEDSEAGIASGLSAGLRVVAVRHCRSTPSDSPWLARAHAQVEDWRQVSSAWIQRLPVSE